MTIYVTININNNNKNMQPTICSQTTTPKLITSSSSMGLLLSTE